MNAIVSSTDSRSIEPIRSNVSRVSRGKTYTAAIAYDKHVAADAYRVRYASYLDSGFITPNPDKIFRDSFDNLQNSTSIVVYDADRPVGSVRICLMSRSVREAPAHHAFPEAVDAVLAHATRSRKSFDVAEITRLVRSPDCANNQGLVFLLYRLAGHVVLRHDVQAILSSVRRNHIPFYNRLGFAEIAGPTAYPGLSCPMHLLECSRSEYDRVRNAFPLMNPQATPSGSFDGFLSGRPIAMPLTFGE